MDDPNELVYYAVADWALINDFSIEAFEFYTEIDLSTEWADEGNLFHNAV